MPDYDLKIVALGDSLTTKVYTDELERLVRTEGGFPNATVVGKGYPGATTQELASHFQQDVLDEQPQIVVIQGGTNDLGLTGQKIFLDILRRAEIFAAENGINTNQSYEDILQEIKAKFNTLVGYREDELPGSYRESITQTADVLSSMHEMAKQHNISSIAVNVPSANRPEVYKTPVVLTRVILNRLSRQYCDENDTPYVDLFMATSDPETGMMLPQYSAGDILHFNEEGSKLKARLVFDYGMVLPLQKHQTKKRRFGGLANLVRRLPFVD
jgi:lysophospholipase L1-like esterase